MRPGHGGARRDLSRLSLRRLGSLLRIGLPAVLWLLSWNGAVAGGHNSSARARAFAALPDWTGLWISEAWPLEVSGRPAGGDAVLKQTLQLIRPPPYNPEWKAKYDEGMKDTAALAKLGATFRVCTRGFPAIMEAPWMFQVAVLPEETM